MKSGLSLAASIFTDPETLKAVAQHSQEIAKALNAAPAIPVKVVFKPVMTTPDDITALCQAGQQRREVHRFRELVPYVLALQDVDQRPEATAQAPLPSAYPIQSRHALGHD